MTDMIVEKMTRDGLLIHHTEVAPPNEDPGAPCDGVDGNLFDARSFNRIGCLKDGELLAQKMPHTGMFCLAPAGRQCMALEGPLVGLRGAAGLFWFGLDRL